MADQVPSDELTDVTLGEVWRGQMRIERKIDQLKFISPEQYSSDMTSIHARLTKMESDVVWAWRTVVALVLTIVGAIVVYFITGGPS